MINLRTLHKNMILVLLFWMILEGVFRRWIFPSLSSPLFLVKWALCIVIYFNYYVLMGRFRLAFLYPYQFFLFFYMLWCLLTIFLTPYPNPWIVYGIGLFVHLIFIPLHDLIKSVLTSEKILVRAIDIFTYVSIPLIVFSFFQFYLPADHILNRFVNEEQLITKTGLGYTRVTSVFTFVKLYNVYLLFLVTLLTPIIYYRMWQNQSMLLYLIVDLMAIIATLMSGSRLATFLTFFNIMLISGYVFVNYQPLRKMVGIGFVMLPVILIMAYNTITFIRNAVDSFWVRFERAGYKYKTEEGAYLDVYARTVDRIDILKYASKVGLAGWGVGVAYQGNDARLETKFPEYYEEEGERLGIETGIVGIIITLLMRLFIFLHSIAMVRSVKSPFTKILLYSLLIYQLPHVFMLSNTIYNYMDNFVYWLSFGIILAIGRINQQVHVGVTY